MLADWLGSDTDFFPYSLPDDADRMMFAGDRAKAALAAVGLDVGAKRLYVGNAGLSFTDLFPAIPGPNPMQCSTGRLDASRLTRYADSAGGTQILPPGFP